MMQTMAIAAAGLRAAGVRIAVAADNTANWASIGRKSAASGSGPTVYAAKTVQQTSTGAGPLAVVGEKTPPYTALYYPEHSAADAEGNVYVPAVALDEEAVDVMSAAASYRANAKVIREAARMDRTLLNLLG
jgi:flagellar basal-body rod protein FlgC